nr:transposase [Kribbella qitaiheensis]
MDPHWYSESESLTSEYTRNFFQLTDRSWAKIRPLIPEPAQGSETWRNNDLRNVIENIVWKLRTGARWDDIRIDYGSTVTVSAWYHQWDKDGIWTQIEKVITLHTRRS